MMRATPTPTPVATAIWEALSDWLPDSHDPETDPRARWEIAATFHHDYQYHILVAQWAPNPNGTFTRAGYSLWFAPGEGPAVYVDEWPRASEPPLIMAGAHVMAWQRMVKEASYR